MCLEAVLGHDAFRWGCRMNAAGWEKMEWARWALQGFVIKASGVC